MKIHYTIEAARQARKAGVPWCIRVEYTGYNPNTKDGHSSKFWSASGEGYGTCTIRWGKIGSRGQSTTKPFNYVEDKLPSKLAKGYKYAQGVQDTYGSPKPKLEPLTGPFALIRALKVVPGGFQALDDRGSVLFDLAESGGSHLRDTYGIPVVG